MRKLAAVLSMAIVCALAPVAANARTGDCEQVMLRSWNVKVDVAKKAYRFGEKAGLTLTVTRKKTDTPVSGARAAVMLTNNEEKAVFGVSETNIGGVASIKVPLKRSQLDAGSVKLYAYVYSAQVDTVCASVVEYGYKEITKAFRVKG